MDSSFSIARITVRQKGKPTGTVEFRKPYKVAIMKQKTRKDAMTMEILERAYAKLNISLDTPFAHADGEQEWDMLMVAIDLADTVTIRTTTAHTNIIVDSTSGLLPLNEKPGLSSSRTDATAGWRCGRCGNSYR